MVPPSRLIRSAPLPLIVDVDGGLLVRDPVQAALAQILCHRPAAGVRMLRAAPEQRPFVLQALLAAPGAPLPCLTVRRVAMDAMGLWQRFGAPVVLISRLPEAMVAHLRDVLCPGARPFGARPYRSLGPAGKAELLAAAFGPGGFDLLARAQGAGGAVPLARRAMLVGLTPQGKRRLLTAGVHATALPVETRSDISLRLRAGAGWTVDWDPRAPAPDAAEARPETRPPSRDVSAAGRLRRGRAGRS